MTKADKNDALAARKGKASKLNVLVFEPEGGAPYTVEVNPDGGTFTLPGKDGDNAYRITRGSVWIEGGTPRTCINAGNPQTVNIHTLTGNDVLHPAVYDGDINNNLAVQVTRAAKTKPVWQRGTTWAIGLLGIALAGLMFWQIKVLGGGFEQISEAFQNLKIIVEQKAQESASGGGAGAHNDIAPGGV